MNRLRQLREKEKLTFKELSKQLQLKNVHISPDSLAKYEREERKPKIEKWQALADFYGVSVDYLKGLTTNTTDNGYSKDYIYNQLLDGYNNDWQENIDDIPQPQVISLKYEVDNYLKKNKIKKPKKLTLDFIKDNFSFIFSDSNIKRLLTTKDSYSDDEIKENLTTALFLQNLLLKKNHCRYCHGGEGKNMLDNHDELKILEGPSENYYFDVVLKTDDISNPWIERTTGNINYCPMCGRKLTK